MTPAAPPGWYPDPWRLAPLRWYDGVQWTPYLQGGWPQQQPLQSPWPQQPEQPEQQSGWQLPTPAPRRGPHPGWTVGLAVCLAVVLLLGISVALGLRGCPDDDAQCDHYVLLDDSLWRVPASGPLVIRYEVNTANPSLTPAQVLGAVAAATRTWEAADPQVRFQFAGTTSVEAGVQDGRTVFGTGTVEEEAVAYEESYPDDRGDVVEADVVLSRDVAWVWHPCPQRDGGCTGYADDDPEVQEALDDGRSAAEVQSVLTHELGHLLSLGHPGRALSTTMSTDWDNLALYPQTLARGDVLGVRAAYPCGACGGPPSVLVP